MAGHWVGISQAHEMVDDELREEMEWAKGWLRERDVMPVDVVMFGWNTVPNALWKGSDGGRLAFLEACVRAGSTLVWVRSAECRLDHVDELHPLRPWITEEDWTDVQQRLGALCQYEGLVATYELHWSYGGVLNTMLVEAAWADGYLAFLEHLEGMSGLAEQTRSAHEAEEGRREAQQAYRQEQEAQARELIAHPKYGDCQNRNDRKYLARELFGDDVSLNDLVLQAETLSRLALDREGGS